jgi:hypothetical protein
MSQNVVSVNYILDCDNLIFTNLGVTLFTSQGSKKWYVGLRVAEKLAPCTEWISTGIGTQLWGKSPIFWVFFYIVITRTFQCRLYPKLGLEPTFFCITLNCDVYSCLAAKIVLNRKFLTPGSSAGTLPCLLVFVLIFYLCFYRRAPTYLILASRIVRPSSIYQASLCIHTYTYLYILLCAEVGSKSFIAITLPYVFALWHNASTLRRKFIALGSSKSISLLTVIALS